ncbi:MAG: ATP-binding protein [Actinomycetota bacterium]|nr:ATP-binding protein [Actinomycetota bacterium]
MTPLGRRVIPPDLFTAVDLEPATKRLLLCGLMQLAEDSGCCRWDAREIRALVLPYADTSAEDVETLLGEFESDGRAWVYEVDGKRYAFLADFPAWQRSMPRSAKPMSVPLPSGIEFVPSEATAWNGSGKYLWPSNREELTTERNEPKEPNRTKGRASSKRAARGNEPECAGPRTMRAGRFADSCPAYWLRRAAGVEATSGRTDEVEYLREMALETQSRQAEVIPHRFRDATCDESLGDHGLYLYGPVGSGKTYLAAALALKAIHDGRDTKWLSCASWLGALKASFSGAEAPRPSSWFADCDLLAVDDVGAEKPSEWVVEQLFQVVNRAYEDDVQLIVTSNLSLTRLQDRIGERIVSRFAEMCDLREMNGADRRIEAAFARKKANPESTAA